MKPPKAMQLQQTIDTMRLLLAALVRKHGVFDRLEITEQELAVMQTGKLAVEDRPNGTIVLRVKDAPKAVILTH